MIEHARSWVSGPRGLLALEAHEDRRRLRVADPDRQERAALRDAQQDDRLLADEVEAHAVDRHLLHGLA